MRIIKQKKGMAFNMIMGITVFVLVISQLLYSVTITSPVEDKPIGTTQTAMQLAAIHGDEALIYLDTAVTLAKKNMIETFNKEGGNIRDPEGETFVCGEFMESSYWNNNEQQCIPDFKENLLDLFEGTLFTLLSEHPNYGFPAMPLQAEQIGTSLYITSPADVKLTLPFYGGGDKTFSLGEKISFPPDYPGAASGTAFSYASRGETIIDTIVTHYTVTHNHQDAVNVLLKRGKVGYHYIIDHDGTVYQHVAEEKVAGHAGCPSHYGPTCKPGYNSRSIGISFVNMGYEYEKENAYVDETRTGKAKTWEPYTKAQIESFTYLVADIALRHPGILENQQLKEGAIIGHSFVNPKNKFDPGPAFESQQETIERRINALLIDQEALFTAQKQQENKETIKEKKVQSSTKGIKIIVDKETQNRMQSYNTIIEKYSQKTGLEKEFIQAIIIKESRGVASAKATGSSALGLMQIIPKWHHIVTCVPECGFSEEVKQAEYFDPEKNICCGTHILKKLTEKKTISWDCKEADKKDGTKGKHVMATYSTPYEKAARRYQSATCNKDREDNIADTGIVVDYVEQIMGVYEYLGGNVKKTFSTVTDTNFQATYELPIGFQTNLPVNIKAYTDIEDIAKEILEECNDNTDTCLRNKLQTFNEEHPEAAINTFCNNNLLAYEFMQQITGCMNRPDGWPCSITLTEQAPYAFFIRLNDEGIQEISLTSLPLYGVFTQEVTTTRSLLPATEINNIQTETELQTHTISFGFYAKEEETQTTLLIDAKEQDTIPITERTYTFTKEEGKLIYHQENTPSIPAVPGTYLLCKKESEGRGLTFALKIQDTIPPPVNTITSIYDAGLNVYELEWEPTTQYEDTTIVEDIMAYDIYCTTEKPGKIPLEEEKSFTITRKDKKLFPVEEYSKQKTMSAILDQCAGKEIEDEQLYVRVVAIDNVGQYHLDYKTITLEQPKEPSKVITTKKQEQNNEIRTPELKPIGITTEIPASLADSQTIIKTYYAPEATVQPEESITTTPCPEGTRERRIGVLGSSSVEAKYNFVNYLNKKNAGTFYKHGYWGKWSAWLLKYAFKKDILDNKYDDMIIFNGINDLPGTTDLYMLKTTYNLKSMYAQAKNAHMRVIAITIQPTKGADGYWNNKTEGRNSTQVIIKTINLNNWIMNDAKNIDVRIDAYTMLEEPGIAAMQAQYVIYTVGGVEKIGDRLHFNSAGHDALGELIYKKAYANVERCIPTS